MNGEQTTERETSKCGERVTSVRRGESKGGITCRTPWAASKGSDDKSAATKRTQNRDLCAINKLHKKRHIEKQKAT